jgi:hypothetical protein
MWTISDFPAYGLISGLTYKGYKGCPCCGPNTDARMAKTGDMLPNRIIRGTKIVYGGIHRYLPRHHPYRRNRRFNGLEEDRLRPKPLSGVQFDIQRGVNHTCSWVGERMDPATQCMSLVSNGWVLCSSWITGRCCMYNHWCLPILSTTMLNWTHWRPLLSRSLYWHPLRRLTWRKILWRLQVLFIRIEGIHVSMYLLEMCVTLVMCFVQHLLDRHILDVMHCE